MDELIKRNRVRARKIRLNSYDCCCFDEVPDFIVEDFFGKSTYKNRMTVTSFAFLNGIQLWQLVKLIHWRPKEDKDINKVIKLYNDFETQLEYRQRYYSYDVISNNVTYLDGHLRLHGRRVL